MPDFKEDLLQYIWQHKLLNPAPLISNNGKQIFILSPGELNKDSGPDFFNSKIKIEDLILVGNIEVHIKTSDWLKHNHQNDKNYNNIILHVVYENDILLSQNKNNNVEVLEIKNLIPQNLIAQYHNIITTKQTLACANQLQDVSDVKFTLWIDRMFTERLEYKTKNIEQLFENYKGDYLQTFYTVLLRNFGFKVNALPFELLAKQLPIKILLKHANNLLQLEALLLGSSGLLEQQLSHKYIIQLQNEFEFLKNKYQIVPLQKELFKFSRLRPANFATLRLAQFAKLIFTCPELFNAPHTFNSYDKILNALSIKMEDYWKNHYHVKGNEVEKEIQLGESSISNIITNTFANFFFFYFKKTAITEFESIPHQLLEKCAFENNVKTKLYLKKKALLKNAADSQALINLHDNYCSKRKCLSCGIASAILKSAL